MIKANKQTLLSIGAGFLLGVVFLVINVLFTALERPSSTANNLKESIFLPDNDVKNNEDLLAIILNLFAFNVDAIETEDVSLTLENISVKIVAQSKVGDEIHTLLEVITPKETKRLVVTTGTIVKGFLIKSIDNKEIILVKDDKEYTVKLFHPKELNQNRITNDLK
ncbi:hypothetical protein [Colwellia sp. E2M01]|uniref:hypothetical protein n=1 Tax=Colwellia sp. E2M01 TaxID=2841561 RepID=UPI001C08A386|nr:hypothetical protein [Colwellia sp. E2M01]MBU2869361.1 hypothetical protein [Colwellia sp. E2M01]